MLEGDDEPDLLLAALRVLLESAARVEVEAGDQVGLVEHVDIVPEVGEVLDRLTPGEPVVQRELTRQIADAPMDGHRIDGRLHAEDAGTPAGGPDEVEQGPDRGRLARPVGPEEPEHLALLDLEVDIDDAATGAVALGQPLGLDDRAHGAPPLGVRTRRTRHLAGADDRASPGPRARPASSLRSPNSNMWRTRTGPVPKRPHLM